MNSTVIRKCNHCGFKCDQENWRFTYLKDDVWQCAICGSKHTHIVEVVNPNQPAQPDHKGCLKEETK